MCTSRSAFITREGASDSKGPTGGEAQSVAATMFPGLLAGTIHVAEATGCH